MVDNSQQFESNLISAQFASALRNGQTCTFEERMPVDAQKRFNSGAVFKKYMKQRKGVVPDGLSVFRERQVNVRKASDKKEN